MEPYNNDRADIYEMVTERFIESLERGVVPWQMSWKAAQNIVSRKPYRGINVMLLGLSKRGNHYWMTFKQALDLGGSVKKGEKSSLVIYYKLLGKTDEKGDPKISSNGRQECIPYLKYSRVFNLEQTEGIESPQGGAEPVSLPAIEAAEAIAAMTPCPIQHTGMQACYLPSMDQITMPAKESFYRAEGYYHTLFHEMTHATGHASRLNRDGITSPIEFGSECYSKEELIAELGASFLSNEAGTLDQVEFDNSSSYLASWLRKLKSDKKFIVSASSKAQKAVEFILTGQV